MVDSIFTPDSTVVQSLVQYLLNEYGIEELQEAGEKVSPTSAHWPERYINRETGRAYEPHHELERIVVYSDTPKHILVRAGEGAGKSVLGIVKTLERIRRGCSGLLVCVAGETVVNGIPIAERTRSLPVNTLLGSAWASSSFCEGKADLFRVVTQSGDRVLVTSNHRFLTPVGWYPLRDLHVGSLIAVDDTEHGRTWRETQLDFPADYSQGLHPYDGFANLLEQYGLDKWLQLALLSLAFSPCYDYLARAYTDSFSRLPNWASGAMEHQPLCEVDARGLGLTRAFHTALQEAYRSDNLQAWPHCSDFHFEDSDEEMLTDRFPSRRYLRALQNTQPDQRSLATQALGQTVPQPCFDHALSDDHDSSYQHYTIRFSEVQEIAFEKHGEFYGLTVPGIGHYSAQGIFHHNSPDFEHFRKLWPEFQRWCPWERVHERHQYRADVSRIPNQPFLLAFDNDVGTVSTLMCGGIQETNTKAWEGPNVNFAWMDEMRRHQTPAAMKTLLGRIRIPGPHGEHPQLWITTTPSKHWLYEYFGDMTCKCSSCGASYEWDLAPNTIPTCPVCKSTLYTTADPWESFKRQSAVIKMSLKDNEKNLYDGFSNDRALSLTEKEARVLLEGEWEDLDDTEHFLPSITLWDTCQSTIPPLTPNEPLVLGIDAAKGRTNSYSDCFAIVGVTRHWDKDKRKDHVVVRLVYTWQARPGQSIIFKMNTHDDPNYHGPEGPEEVIRRLTKDYRVVQLAYDPFQLHDLGTRLARERLVWANEFGQQSERTEADSDLLQLILSRRILHDGNQTLREHIENADRKVTDEGNKLRIVKRLDHLKIDSAVALSMAAYRCLHLNIW